MKDTPSFNFRPMYRKELASLLGISLSTFARKLDKKQVVLPHDAVEPPDQYRVFKALWYPSLEWQQAFEALYGGGPDEV